MDVRKKLKIFIHPVDGAGHINACIGLGQTLAQRGHEIVLLTGGSFSSMIEQFGFRFVLLEDPPSGDNSKSTTDPMQELIDFVQNSVLLTNKSPIEKFRTFVDRETTFLDDTLRKCAYFNGTIEQLVKAEQPDLFIVDNFLVEPIVLNSGIPWISLSSGNPIGLYDGTKLLPPSCSGFPTNSDKTLWKEFEELKDQYVTMAAEKQNQLLRQFDYPANKQEIKFAMLSEYMNIYGYPEELDYNDVVPRPDNFVQVDSFCRETKEKFNLPEEFKDKINPGDKLVYFSLGSMGSFSVPLMESIISVLAKTPHKYIVFLPQTALLPMVDLVITHGGNNTVTETFSFGKPMIVMPLFADQYDNAQRIQEKGFGVRINPFEFDANVLIESIDKLLFDTKLNQKLCAISQRIQQSNSKEKACIAIEQMVELFHAKQTKP